MYDTGRPEVVVDAEHNPEWVYSRPDHRWIKSYVGAPIRFRNRVLGFLNVNGATTHFFTPAHADQLLAFADQAAIAIENARLYRQVCEELTERLRVEDELRKYQQHLEDLVEERTRDLESATREAEEARKAAEAANQAKSIFLANMSHELRSPLNAILGFAQVMSRSETLADEHVEELEIILRSGEHLLALINQVLDLSKIEAGRVTIDKNNCDLYGMLQNIEDMFAYRIQNKPVQLHVEHTGALPHFIHTDEVKLRQILINLLNNAVKFTQEGSVTFHAGTDLRVRPTEEEHTQGCTPITLYFEVSDTGPGIAPDEMDTLFEAFSQTESGRQAREGTGLGLTISRKFARLMGGDMQVRSEVGSGTTFRLTLPVEVPDTADIEPVAPIRRVLALEPHQCDADGKPYRILIVDNMPDNCRLLRSLLSLPVGAPNNRFQKPEAEGFELREAKNGQEAIDIWKSWHPHLIFMDMRMPVMDGYEATKKIRRLEVEKLRLICDQETEEGQGGSSEKSQIFQPASGQAQIITSHIKIIAITASAFEEERAKVLDAGCDDFIRKPFQEHEIFEALRKFLGIRFLYEQQEPEAADSEPIISLENSQNQDSSLTREALETLPVEWLTTLKLGAETADIASLSELIERIRTQDANIADELIRLIHNFEYDHILSLL